MSDKKKKRDNEPSKEDAAVALEAIKTLQKTNDEDLSKKRKEEYRQQIILQEQERLKIQLAQEKVKKALKKNLLKKEEEKRKESIKNSLELSVGKNSKVKWKIGQRSNYLLGYVENKLMFEIHKGLSLFSLYIKDKKLMEDKKLKSYQGCSMELRKLKEKSNKLI
jgi:hypothetical protein